MTDAAVPTDQAPRELASITPAAPAIVVAIAADGLSARLSFAAAEAAPAGPPVTRDDLLVALAAAGVVQGILDAALDAAVAAGRADALLVAVGRPAVDGCDASFQLLIPDAKSRTPKLDEHGAADFRELGIFFSVRPGTALMRRAPATAGVAGFDVLGHALPPVPGRDTPFAPMLAGAAVDAREPTLLVASITGQPVVVTHGVVVEPTLTLAAVDMSTGHIEFEGSVNVLGDVKAGMKIRAAGDVTVGGVVEAAEIRADGDITIKGGIIGHGEWSEAVAAHVDTARIVSGGSVHTRFAENAWIQAAGCIFVLEASRQCLISAINKVLVGPADGSKGQIIGGRTQATLLVQTAVLGSAAGVRTQVEVGVNPALLHKLEVLRARLQQLAKEQADVTRLLDYARAQPQRIGPELRQKAERTAASLAQEIAEANAAQDVFNTQLELADGAACIVGQKVYGGSKVRVGDQLSEIEDECGGGVYRLAEGPRGLP